MKIGVLSDSHKNIRNLKEAFRYLKDIEKVDWVFHLGDDYSDARTIERIPLPIIGGRRIHVIRIPGVYDPEYKDPKIDNRIVKIFEGWKILLSHTPGRHENDLPQDVNPDLAAQSLGLNLILYGHSHIPKIEEKGRIFYVNPGHLKDEDKKGSPPSFAVLDVTKPEIQVKIIGLKDKQEIDKFSILSMTE